MYESAVRVVCQVRTRVQSRVSGHSVRVRVRVQSRVRSHSRVRVHCPGTVRG